MRFYSVGFCLACTLLFGESMGSYERPRSHNRHITFVEIINRAEMEENSKALLQASLDGDKDAVMSLVRRNCNINFKGDGGITPLIGATEKGHIGIAKYLLRYGAHVNARKASNSRTPLMIACRNNNSEMVKLLMMFKANVDLRDYYGLSAFDIAISGNNKEILMILLTLRNGLDGLFETIEDKNTKLLFYASQYGQKNVVNYCIESLGVNINSKGASGETPLIIAAKYGKSDVVQYLLNQKVDADAQMFDDKSTALIFACAGGFQDIVKILLTYGANVNLYDKYDNSPLIFAINNNHTEIVEMLIAADADISHKNKSGETAKSIALSHQKASRNNSERDQWQRVLDLLHEPKSNFNGLLR